MSVMIDLKNGKEQLKSLTRTLIISFPNLYELTANNLNISFEMFNLSSMIHYTVEPIFHIFIEDGIESKVRSFMLKH